MSQYNRRIKTKGATMLPPAVGKPTIPPSEAHPEGISMDGTINAGTYKDYAIDENVVVWTDKTLEELSVAINSATTSVGLPSNVQSPQVNDRTKKDLLRECPYCSAEVPDLLKHLKETHFRYKPRTALGEVNLKDPVECPKCHGLVNKWNLDTHIKYRCPARNVRH